MSDEQFEEFLDLSELTASFSHRGRKSEVDPALVERLLATPIGKGWYFEGADMVESNAAYVEYLSTRGKPRPKMDGKMESLDEAHRRAVTSWQARYRQRASAVAKAADVEAVIKWTTDGRLVVARLV